MGENLYRPEFTQRPFGISYQFSGNSVTIDKSRGHDSPREQPDLSRIVQMADHWQRKPTVPCFDLWHGHIFTELEMVQSI